MGKGIDLAREDNPELAQALDDMKDQLIIVLINRLGGRTTIPISEVDGTGDKVLTMNVNQEKKSFNFEVRKKH
jgi:hypothetical protein